MHRLIDELEAVEAPRIGNAKKHKLGDILFIAIAAGVADAYTWNQIEDLYKFSAFGAKNETEESQ